jgi:hypothetical protein
VVGATVTAGADARIAIVFTEEAAPINTLQFDLALTTGLTLKAFAAGAAASAAGKSVQVAAIDGGARVVVFGLNAMPIHSGTVATLDLNVGSAALGTLGVKITRIVAADGNANQVAASGGEGSVTVR